ncbi:MAG: DEAD/DEAH box helicase family protein, partial [Deltaproteobacteria bacterium]|nr:DEAD/DEAH box helicase family protein [Deltaproteobacteria bacterium]
MSETEPELGVGIVREQDQQSVVLQFAAAGQTRRYGKRTAPLKRLVFRVGDTVEGASGERLTIERVELRDQLNWYVGGGKELCESDLSPRLRLQRPLSRLLAGQWDALPTYELRRRTLELSSELSSSPWRGLVGPRAQLLPHQLYVASQIATRGLPRALLADEVGLGKTIEAGWVLHQLLVTARAERALVLVPRALINQWFIELLRRFNLAFWVPESQSEEGLRPEDLAEQPRVILSLESLREPSLAQGLAATSWDIVIVDEAHRVGWAPGAPSPEYELLERLAAGAGGLLLLTAT